MTRPPTIVEAVGDITNINLDKGQQSQQQLSAIDKHEIELNE